MSVRIYKDDLRQPIYRTLLLTDMAIFILIAVCIAGISYLFVHSLSRHFNWMTYFFLLGILEPTLLMVATLRIDNQHIYKILARASIFAVKKKKLRNKQLPAYYNDFTIQDDLLIRKKSISKVFRIHPYDISALNSSDRETFFTNLKQTLHILPAQL